LYEAGLIYDNELKISLARADLRNINLEGVSLSKGIIGSAEMFDILEKAEIENVAPFALARPVSAATLAGTDLRGANLKNAQLASGNLPLLDWPVPIWHVPI
jgi:uncharacterized protein YjbI with pentapeptide repeats